MNHATYFTFEFGEKDAQDMANFLENNESCAHSCILKAKTVLRLRENDQKP